MLDALRKGASGWLAQIFIALLVLSFAVWGVSDIFSGFRADTVATVGGTDVSAQKFFRQYDLAKRQFGQQIGRSITDEQARMFGLPNQVLGRLVTEASLTDEADTLGLGVSGDVLAKQITEDPVFQGATGSFDRNRFIQSINQLGMSEDQFVEQLKQSYIRQQLVSALAGNIEVPDAYMRAYHDYQNEERDLTYLVLTPALAGDIADPTETELATFFEEHKSDWRAPEYRSARVMAMTPADMANTADISDEEARQTYDARLDSQYTEPEKRQIQQIVFKDSAEASDAAASLGEGKTFDELMTDRNLKPSDVDLGLMTKDKVLDPTVADAAFALELNSVSEVIDGRFGPVLLRVTTIEPAVVESFDDVKGDIKQELAEAKAAQEIADLLDVIEDARAGGSTLDEIAANYDLDLVTYPAIDRAGQDADGELIADLPNAAELVAAIYDSDVGLENNPIALEQGYVWFDVTAVSAERDRELSEVREKVVAAYKADAVAAKLTEIGNAIRDRINQGEAIDAIAGEQGVAVETAPAVKRASPALDDLPDTAIAAAFGGPEGYVTVTDGIDDAKVVVSVTGVNVPPYFSGAADLAETEDRLSTDIANGYLQEYVTQLQERLGVAVNQATLQQLIGLSDPGA